MADLMKELEELCEKATVSIAKANQKLATDTNALSVSDFIVSGSNANTLSRSFKSS